MITDGTGLCALCGRRYVEEEHHLLFGTYGRALAEEDGITIPACKICHRLAEKTQDRIHDNPIAERLSKMLGQSIWGEQWLLQYSDLGRDAKQRKDDAFRKRYGKLIF